MNVSRKIKRFRARGYKYQEERKSLLKRKLMYWNGQRETKKKDVGTIKKRLNLIN
jgi:hypothetical protein